MSNWYSHPKYIPDEVRTLEQAEAAYALREAWKRVYGQYPSDKSLAVLWAKSALETGRWKHIHCFNFGNIKRKQNDEESLFTMFECGEEVSLAQAQKLVAEDSERIKILRTYSWSNGSKRASINVKPGHLWSQFIGHKTVEDGAEHYLMFVSQSTRYAKAWQKVIEGNPEGYSHELKIAGYYTADEKTYTAGVVRLFNEFLRRKDELMSWQPEKNDTDPSPPPDMNEVHDIEVDNPLPEHDDLPDIPEYPVHEEHDTDVESNGRMTTVVLIVASVGGFLSWLLQSCQ